MGNCRTVPWDPSSSDRVPAVGDIIASKYEVLQVLGAGGMGVVVAARHQQLGQRVAIKFIRGEAAHDANAVERFLREARAAVALSSEHVTRVLDVGTLETGAPYIVMEHLAGVDLAELLRRHGPMPMAEAVGTILQACEAVAEAHAMGVVHRDLKPANLFVVDGVDGTPFIKILDFGISKITDINKPSGSTLTSSGSVMGSPAYMSPEQVRNAKAVDARSDVWSLGVILYELLAGEAPFAGETLGEVFAKIIVEAPPAVTLKRPDVPPALASTIMRCLERDLDRRTPSVAHLATDLLPFGPPDAGRSVARILRFSGVSSARGAAQPNETLLAPGRASVRSRPSPMRSTTEDSGASGTAPPWHTSEAGRSRASRSRGTRVVGAAAIAIVSLASVTSYLVLRAPSSATDVHPAAPPPTVAPPAAAAAPAADPVSAVRIADEAPVVAPPVATRVPTSVAPPRPPSRPVTHREPPPKIAASAAPAAPPEVPATPTTTDPFSGLMRK